MIAYFSRRVSLISIALLAAVASSGYAASPENCSKPVLFFDLGDTLVDTSSTNFQRVTYIPGAHGYLSDLRAKGYRMLMIVNVPAAWGKNEDERAAATAKYLQDHWVDTRPFDWSLFERVITPEADELRKPHPHMFQIAKTIADATACPAIFQGEAADEISTAGQLGMFGFHVGERPEFFLPEPEFAEFVRRN